MKYISRRLLVVDENQREFECSDIEFIDIDAPLIVIGEPGAGKTELMQLASTKLDTDFIIASSVTAGLDISASINTIIIDGIDEITAYERVTPINKILSQLPSDTRFILSCRAADWQDTVNKKIISQKWKKHPVVGRLLPLSNEDIISFVNASGESLSGEDFFRKPKRGM
jgi:DNA polymerase III delta prime subunit